MSLIPEFEIGILNLWICTVLLFALPALVSLFTKTSWKRALTKPETSGSEKMIYYIWIGVQPAIYLYSIFVPFVFKSIWFYLGSIVFILGMIIMVCSTYMYQTTPQDKLITRGIYKVSRNPDYFSAFLAYIGMGLMGLAWPILMLAIAHLILYQITTKYEERMCTKLWPNEFGEYKKKVAKNFLFF